MHSGDSLNCFCRASSVCCTLAVNRNALQPDGIHTSRATRPFCMASVWPVSQRSRQGSHWELVDHPHTHASTGVCSIKLAHIPAIDAIVQDDAGITGMCASVKVCQTAYLRRHVALSPSPEPLLQLSKGGRGDEDEEGGEVRGGLHLLCTLHVNIQDAHLQGTVGQTVMVCKG